MSTLQNTIQAKNSDVLDPVDAYDVLAARFAELSAERNSYLASIEKVIVSQIPRSARSMLDIGSGDGVRASRIASEAGIEDLVLLEPSSAMRAHISGDAEVWPIRAQDLFEFPRGRERRFDVITCLWNVFGHIPTGDRKELLQQVRRLLSPSGTFFIDVIHRYNVRSYGITRTALRYLKDHFTPNPANGDVIVRWTVPNQICATHGHVFTNPEIMALAEDAGLEPKIRFVLDYGTGRNRCFAFQGNLLYAFQAISESNSASAVTTKSTSTSVI